jgi:hypothetical protein
MKTSQSSWFVGRRSLKDRRGKMIGINGNYNEKRKWQENNARKVARVRDV